MSSCIQILSRNSDYYRVYSLHSGQEYTIQFNSGIPSSCSCPDHRFRKRQCKHMYSVMNDYSNYLNRLRNQQLINRQHRDWEEVNENEDGDDQDSWEDVTTEEDENLVEEFKSLSVNVSREVKEQVDDCAVCLQEMDVPKELLQCVTCKKFIHQYCWLKWCEKRPTDKQTCVMCVSKFK